MRRKKKKNKREKGFILWHVIGHVPVFVIVLMENKK